MLLRVLRVEWCHGVSFLYHGIRESFQPRFVLDWVIVHEVDESAYPSSRWLEICRCVVHPEWCPAADLLAIRLGCLSTSWPEDLDQ